MSENMISEAPVYVICWNKQPDKNDDVILREKDKFPEFQFGTHWMMWSYSKIVADMYRTKFLCIDDPDSVYIWEIKETSLKQIFELSDYDIEDMELIYFKDIVQPFEDWKKTELINSFRVFNNIQELKMYYKILKHKAGIIHFPLGNLQRVYYYEFDGDDPIERFLEERNKKNVVDNDGYSYYLRTEISIEINYKPTAVTINPLEVYDLRSLISVEQYCYSTINGEEYGNEFIISSVEKTSANVIKLISKEEPYGTRMINNILQSIENFAKMDIINVVVHATFNSATFRSKRFSFIIRHSGNILPPCDTKYVKFYNKKVSDNQYELHCDVDFDTSEHTEESTDR